MAQKTTFGLGQIAKEAPSWAPWIFRSYFIISKALLGYLAASHLFSPTFLTEAMTLVTFLLDPLMYGFSKMFGIEVEEADTTKTLIADKQIESDGEITKVTPVTIPPVTPAPPGVEQPEDVIKSN